MSEPARTAGEAVQELVDVMDRLRSPGGCPWDAEQTHTSLLPYLVEETYEVVDAVERGGRDDVVEELGDLLLQVVFHARLAHEHEQPFSMVEVADGIAAKLRRRHPHVFGDVVADSAEQVSANWETIKAAEKGRTHPLEGIPGSLPALARADKVLSRLERAGLSPTIEPADTPARGYAAELFDVVRRARADGVDPEAALRELLNDVSAQASG